MAILCERKFNATKSNTRGFAGCCRSGEISIVDSAEGGKSMFRALRVEALVFVVRHVVEFSGCLHDLRGCSGVENILLGFREGRDKVIVWQP